MSIFSSAFDQNVAVRFFVACLALGTILLTAAALHLYVDLSSIVSPKANFLDSSGSKQSCYPKRGLRPLQKRDELGPLLEELGLKKGAEVGVQAGAFSRAILDQWPSCESFRLIDLWAPQKNYADSANVGQGKQDKRYKAAVESVKQHEGKTIFMRMLSVEAAKLIEAESLDFVYIDARHDYCGASEDMEAYWPLVSPGGVMAGHDYKSNAEVLSKKNDWGLCANGTRNESAVKGAVNDFFIPKGLTVSSTAEELPTWVVQKPMC